MTAARNIVALAGGVGGAKLAHGLAMQGQPLSVVVNTGDDFEHLGLTICPDIDTVTYTLAGIANRAQGWGIEGESWAFMDQLARLGGPDWFRLGDRDMALHVLRSHRMAAGDRLTAITADVADSLGVGARILPMSDSPMRTVVETDDGTLPFQDWFVRLRCAPAVRSLRFAGQEAAEPTPEVRAALETADLVVICPSNPFVSIAPILGVPGLRGLLGRPGAPVVAVSPIIAGQAVKGPAARMLADLGHDVSALGVARIYAGLAQGFVLDEADAALAAEIEALGMEVLVAPTLMQSDADRAELASACLDFARGLA